MAEQVVGPDGRHWTVRRRWVPRLPGETLWGRVRRRTRRRPTLDQLDGLDVVGDIGDGIGGIVATIVAVVVLVLLVIFVAPLLLALVEVLALVLLALLAVAARVLLRRPWTVEAVADDGSVRSWRTVGWRASGEEVASVARHLRAGIEPPGAARSVAPGHDG